MNSIEKRKPHGNSRLVKIGRPVLRRKKKAGAPKGNKNAVRHGMYTAEGKARHARVADLCQRANALIAHIEALVRERECLARESARVSAE